MFIECSWCKFWSVALTCKHASVPYWAPPGLQGDRLNCTYISLIPSGHLLTSSRTPSSNRWNSPVEKHSTQMLPQCIPRGHFSLSLSSSLLSLFYMITKNWTLVFPEWLNRTWDTIQILLTRPALKLCASFLWRRWWHVHRRRNGSSVHYWTCKICSTSFFVTIRSEPIPLRWHVLISMCATRWLRNLVILRNIDNWRRAGDCEWVGGSDHWSQGSIPRPPRAAQVTWCRSSTTGLPPNKGHLLPPCCTSALCWALWDRGAHLTAWALTQQQFSLEERYYANNHTIGHTWYLSIMVHHHITWACRKYTKSAQLPGKIAKVGQRWTFSC